MTEQEMERELKKNCIVQTVIYGITLLILASTLTFLLSGCHPLY